MPNDQGGELTGEAAGPFAHSSANVRNYISRLDRDRLAMSVGATGGQTAAQSPTGRSLKPDIADGHDSVWSSYRRSGR